MASFVFNTAVRNAWQGKFVVGTDTYRAMLVTSAYAPNKDTHEFRSSVTNEITGTGYTAGGAVTAVSLAINTTTDVITMTLGAVSWPTSTLTARGAVIYKARGGASSADELVAYVEFKVAGTPADVSSTGGTFDLAASTFDITNNSAA